MDIKSLATKNIVTGLVVTVLLLLNVWRWWPGSAVGHVSDSAQFSRALAPTDFDMPGIDTSTNKPLVKRDLFVNVARLTEKTRARTARHRLKRPRISSSELRRQQQEAEARQAFSGVKLAGVVFRGQSGQAFLTYNGNPVTTGQGQKVFNRFQVLSVTSDSIRLKELKSGLEQTIALSGE